MPPRYAYWTILAGGLPTSFRAAAREDLLPTLRRLQERHPDAELKWFARGRLWSSPDEARQDTRPSTPGRGRDWRPGGEHKDPREPFREAKKARNQALRAKRFERKHGGPGGDRSQAAGNRRAPGPFDRTPGTPGGDRSRAPRNAGAPRPFDRPSSAPRADRREGGTGSWKPRPFDRTPQAPGGDRPKGPRGSAKPRPVERTHGTSGRDRPPGGKGPGQPRPFERKPGGQGRPREAAAKNDPRARDPNARDPRAPRREDRRPPPRAGHAKGGRRR